MLVILAGSLLSQRGCAVRGWIRPVIISGPSMAPTLKGLRWTSHCANCGILLQQLWIPDTPKPSKVTCFNCGHHDLTDHHAVSAPERVLIDTGAYWFKSPKRFELVVLRTDQNELEVKRVIGLPGETVSFQRGDLLINGRRAEASLEEVLSRSVVVSNDRFRGTTPSRWQQPAKSTSSEQKGWSQTKHGFAISADPPDDAWLIYHHENVYQHNEPDRIRDDYPFNHGISRVMSPADDLVLQIDCQFNPPAELVVAMYWVDDANSIKIRLAHDSDDLLVSFPNGVSKTIYQRNTGPSTRLWCGVIDGKLWIKCNNQTFVQKIASTPLSCIAPQRPVALSGKNIQVANLILRRGLVRWTRKPMHHTQIPANHIYVMGDNIPMSIDSRNRGPIDQSRIVGRVVPLRFSLQP